jgi:ribosomal protein S6--L-glutamate ligase
MHIAVLASSDSWYLNDLQRAAVGRYEIVPVTFRRMSSVVGSSGIAVASSKPGTNDSWQEHVALSELAAVIVRTMPPGSLEQVVFRMDALAAVERAGVAVINPAKAIETAVDKYLATCRLHDAGLLVPRSFVCQTVEDAREGFEELGGRVVVKPVFGAEGRGIALVDDEAMAERACKLLADLGAVIYLQEYVEHEGFDWRLLVVGDHVFGIERHNPSDWRTNVSRGAKTKPLEVTAEMAAIARRAAEAVGAPLAGVDVLPGRNGRFYVLEVNAVPGWRALARTLEVDIARWVLNYVESRVG